MFRIATNGTGTLPEGDIHPDLAKRLAKEAADCADRVLQMCIRAIDYCPPVDITFGDFLRGVVTADLDFSPEDEGGYRIVFIQSFREWGIHPRGVRSMGPDSLTWPSGDELMEDLDISSHAESTTADRRKRIDDDKKHMKDRFRQIMTQGAASWNLESDRFLVWKSLGILKANIWEWLYGGDHYGEQYAELFGLIIKDSDAPPTVYRKDGRPTVEIHSVRPAIRRTIHGNTRTDLVVEITQRRRGYFDPAKQAEMDQPDQVIDYGVDGDFKFRAGCTILIDPLTQEVRRMIRTPGTVKDNGQLDHVRRFKLGERGVSGNAFDAGLSSSLAAGRVSRNEPFALLHNLEETNT